MDTQYQNKLKMWKERRERIWEDRQNGLSYNEIANRNPLDGKRVSVQSIMRILARYEKEIEKNAEK